MPELTTECALLRDILEELKAQRREQQYVLAQLAMLTLVAQSQTSTIVGESSVLSIAATPADPGTLIASAGPDVMAVILTTDNTNSAPLVVTTARGNAGQTISQLAAADGPLVFVLLPRQQLYGRMATDNVTGTVLVRAFTSRGVSAHILSDSGR